MYGGELPGVVKHDPLKERQTFLLSNTRNFIRYSYFKNEWLFSSVQTTHTCKNKFSGNSKESFGLFQTLKKKPLAEIVNRF